MELTQRQIDRVDRRTLIKYIKINLHAVRKEKNKIKVLDNEREAYKHQLKGILKRLKWKKRKTP